MTAEVAAAPIMTVMPIRPRFPLVPLALSSAAGRAMLTRCAVLWAILCAALGAATLGATTTLGATLSSPAHAQTPQPFPQPGGATQPPVTQAPSTPRPAPAQTPPAAPTPQAPPPAAPPPAPAASTDPSGAPDPATLGFPVYPGAQFLASYDAGRGQRYYTYGSTATYTEIVAFYRTQLKERGEQVFEAPPTHMFSIGRFRAESMAFPAGVTVKDWTWGGSAGYPNGTLGATPARFPTVLMIVPAPPAPAR